MNQLREKMATTDIERLKEDVIGFVDNPYELDILVERLLPAVGRQDGI